MIILRTEDVQKLEFAKTIIEKEYKSHFTTEQLAQKVGINDCKLKYGFKKLFSTSPYKLLTAVRIDKAKELLEYTDHPMKYIAICIGITDVPTFSKTFKRLTGTSPNEWRRSSRIALAC